ncbi:MAG: hypothetical protein ACYC3I_13380 [Gemmataceae bacterium]
MPYEIVIDGIDLAPVEQTTRAGVAAACRPGIVRISAGNYGGNLGPFHIHLHKLSAARWAFQQFPSVGMMSSETSSGRFFRDPTWTRTRRELLILHKRPAFPIGRAIATTASI